MLHRLSISVASPAGCPPPVHEPEGAGSILQGEGPHSIGVCEGTPTREGVLKGCGLVARPSSHCMSLGASFIHTGVTLRLLACALPRTLHLPARSAVLELSRGVGSRRVSRGLPCVELRIVGLRAL